MSSRKNINKHPMSSSSGASRDAKRRRVRLIDVSDRSRTVSHTENQEPDDTTDYIPSEASDYSEDDNMTDTDQAETVDRQELAGLTGDLKELPLGAASEYTPSEVDD
jgi:hypothetical protein